MKILIVEDAKHFSRPLLKYLEKSGNIVFLIDNSSDLRSFINSNEPIDFALLDLALGQQDSISEGIDNISLLRRAYPFLPILVFTAHARTHSIDQIKNAGANELLQKPLEITETYFNDILFPRINRLIHFSKDLSFYHAKLQLQQLSEDESIDKVLIPLFRCMGFIGVSSISHHGPGEYGMDIEPFYELNGLGDRTYYAAQVKVGDINATASSKSNINAVINQAQAALRKQFIDSENLKRNVDKVFIITTGSITPDAKAILSDYLSCNHKISLIDGNKILDLLNRHKLLHLLARNTLIDQVTILPCIVVDSSSQKPVWEDILSYLWKNGCGIVGSQSSEVFESIMEREEILSTTTGEGFALPHAYNTKLDHHIVIMFASDNSYRWKLSERGGVNFVAVRLIADEENERSSSLRLSLHRTIGRIRIRVLTEPLSAEKKLKEACELLQKELLQNSFIVRSEQIKLCDIDSINQSNLLHTS